MRVLIVEDEVLLAEALGQIMKEAGYCVDLVHDGDSGLEYGQSNLYDIIVLDVMLPFKNGYEIARALRAKKIATPILMLFGFSSGDTVGGGDSEPIVWSRFFENYKLGYKLFLKSQSSVQGKCC